MKMQRYTLEEAEAMARRDKRRIIAFTLGAALIGVAYFSTSRADIGRQDMTELPLPSTAAVPDIPLEPLPFEEPEALAKIHDATPEERMTLDPEALVPVFRHARNQNEQLFKALGIVTLDATLHAELLAAPDAQRLKALRTRGQVLDVERRRREGGTRNDWFVTLRDASGLISHALFAAPPTTATAASGEDDDTIRVGDHLRVDGLFFKVFRQEIEGAWLEGPLVLSHHAITSYPPVDERVARAAPALEHVRDDELGELHGRDEEAFWQLMARAKLLGEETDWSTAQEVDSALLARIFADGATYRGVPVRFPVSRNMGAWAESAPENPLGLDRLTLGFIGNVMWRTPVVVVQWLAPFDMPHLANWNDEEGAKYVEARGWFFRNEVYTKIGGEPGRAPLFVLAAVEPFVPPKDRVIATILWFAFGLTVLVIGSIFFLLRADKRKSSELHEALTRRKRERRQRVTFTRSGAGASAGPS
jgi:hypothetical protein